VRALVRSEKEREDAKTCFRRVYLIKIFDIYTEKGAFIITERNAARLAFA
jgi:hypothetical protein